MSITTCPHCGVKMFPREGVCVSCDKRLDAPVDPFAPPPDPKSSGEIVKAPTQSPGMALFMIGFACLIGLFGFAQLLQLIGFFGVGFSPLGLGLAVGSFALSALLIKQALS